MAFVVKRENNVVYTPHDVETDRRGLGWFLFDSMELHGDKIFQVDPETGRTATYASTNRNVIRVALEMKNRGVGKDDVVVVCCSNSFDAILPIFATLYLNAITASLDKSMSARDTKHLLGLVKPKMIFVEPCALQLIEDSLGDLAPDIVVMGISSKHAQFSEFTQPAREQDFAPDAADDTKTAIILFSSGTTGMPKPICCSHRGVLYASKGLWLTGLDCDVTVHFSSFYWISAFCVTFMTMFSGGTKVVVSGFEPVRALEYFQRYKVTFTILSTTFSYQLTKKLAQSYDTSSLRTVMVGGSAVGEEQMRKCKEFFPNSLVYLAFGQTEVSGIISIFYRSDEVVGRRKPNSCGFPVPGMHIKIVDPETNATLGPNTMGEIRVLTEAFANGFYNVDSSEMLDGDGYLKTGDLGYFDEDDCLYVCDRIKEMFKYLDWHIVPASVESVIHQHPAIRDAVVVGVPHPTDGYHPMAIVSLKEHCTGVDAEEVKTFVNGLVLEREALRAGLKIIGELPKTPTGKIDRKEIREMIRTGAFGVRREDDVVYSPCNFEFERCSLGRLIFDNIKKHGVEIFQIDAATGATETYDVTNDKIVKVALEMKNRGIGSDDVVVVWGSNNMDVVLPIFATLYLNAVTASLDKMVSQRDTAYLLDIMKPKMVFVEACSLKLVEDSLGENVADVEIVVMGESTTHARFCDFLKPQHEQESFVPDVVDDEKTAVLFFSSGTTGMPKPVCCSHYGLMYSINGLLSTGPDFGVTMHFNSFYSITALSLTLMTILAGGRRIAVSGFDPELTLRYFQDYRVTFSFMATSFAYKFTKASTAKYDTSSLHTLMFGGSPMSKEEMAMCKTYFPGALVCLAYGQTEVSGSITSFSKKFDGRDKPNSCGVPVPGMYIKVVDPETDKKLGPNEIGEIRLLTKAFAKGYYNVDSSGMFDSDGYLKTGDVGYFDDDDCLYVCDRIKEMFKYLDWQVVPASVEHVVRQHAAVQDAIVVGVPHPRDGDHPMAIVTLKAGYADVPAPEIETFVNERVLDRERLRAGLKIVEELPKTPSGKINRKEIREMAKSGKL